VGCHVYLRHGTSVCWQFKIRLESGTLTADLTSTVVHSFMCHNTKSVLRFPGAHQKMALIIKYHVFFWRIFFFFCLWNRSKYYVICKFEQKLQKVRVTTKVAVFVDVIYHPTCLHINVVKLGLVIRSRGQGLCLHTLYVKTILRQSIIEVTFIISFISGTLVCC